MTREELREKVARALCYSDGGDKTDPDAVAYYYEHADAAIAIVLEEAAKVADNKQAAKDDDGDGWSSGWIVACEEIAAAIRALGVVNNMDVANTATP